VALLTYIALLAAQPVAGAAASGTEEQVGRIVTATGYYTGVDEAEGGIRLKLNDWPLRFRLPRLTDAEAGPWIQLVTTAAQRGFALRVRFDRTAGRVETQSATVVYPICSLSVGNLPPLGDETVNCPGDAAPAQPASLAALARGLATARPAPRAAVQLLGQALADESLAPNLRSIALRARAEADGALAQDTEWGGEAFDRLMLSALTDSRARVAIDPDNPGARYAVAEALSELGAYDEALAIYGAIGRQWPDEALRVATREGAIYRQRGDYRRALAILDDFAARAGRPDGMRFAYHRAWTLMMLDRFPEVILEIDRGLQWQPDYGSAWQLRSCAHAQLGAIAEARSDQERALELFENLARDGEQGMGDYIEQSRRLVTLLRETRGRATAATLDLACRGPWQRDLRTRPRSPLLAAGGS
jgi:tetratricopeptide (TPR) repeat protein